jgi:hypothetical protein
MPEKLPQTYANHVRRDPPFHFFLIPGNLLLLILSIVNVVRHYHRLEAWILLLIGILFPLATLLMRMYPVRVQDRLIRLEEQLRLEALLPTELLPRIDDLTEAQLIALRFASDDELSALTAKVLASNMKAPEIKKAIVTWRADTFRV